MFFTKKNSNVRFVALTTTSLTAVLRLSAVILSVGALSTKGIAAAGLDSVSSQIDDSKGSVVTEVYSRLPIILDNEHYEQNKTRIRAYIDQGENPNLLFPDRVGSGAHDWSLLCACVVRNDVETINLLRTKGADVNYQNSLGLTPLHWAAYSGHLDAVNELLKPVNGIAANPMLVDNDGLLPSDYFRIALLRGVHGEHLLRGILESAEENEFDKKKATSAQLKNFVENFKSYCEGAESSQRLLKIGLIARSSNILSVSNMISILGDIVPQETSVFFKAAGAVASAIEKHRADQATDRAVDNFSNVISGSDHARVFRNLAYFLGTLYDDSIKGITESGAKTLGEYSAKKVVEYIENLNPENPNQTSQHQSFAYQIRDYFRTLESYSTKGAGKIASAVGIARPTQVKDEEGNPVNAKEILRDGQKRGGSYESPRFDIDEQEGLRLRRLIGGAQNINQKEGVSEDITRTIQPPITGLIFSSFSQNQGEQDASVNVGVTRNFPSQGTVAKSDGIENDRFIAIGDGSLVTEIIREGISDRFESEIDTDNGGAGTIDLTGIPPSSGKTFLAVGSGAIAAEKVEGGIKRTFIKKKK